MTSTFHFTDKSGYNAIRATTDWRFKASQPPPETHPFGAYFTTLPPDTPKLAKKLLIARSKIECVFSFEDAGDLTALRGGRGQFIFFSETDYIVEAKRQRFSGEAEAWKSVEQT